MNKAELVQAVAGKTAHTQKTVAEVLDALTLEIGTQVALGNAVRLVGFGTFDRVYRAQRTARNPKTQEELLIAGHHAPRFRAGKELKEATL